jgi:hypothetical protein
LRNEPIWLSAAEIVDINGYRWIKEDDEELGRWVEELPTDQITQGDFAERIRPYVA